MLEIDLLADLVGQFDDPIGIHHPADGSILYANPRACEIAGCSLSEMRRHHVSDFSLGATAEETRSLAAQLMASARMTKLSFNCAVRSLKGNVTQLHMKLQPIRVGRRDYVMSMGRELSDGDRPLCLVGPKLAAIEIADEGLSIIDALGRIRYVNPACARLFGYADPKEMVGRASTDLIEDTEESRRAADTLLRRTNWSGVLLGLHADGSRMPLHIRCWRTEGMQEEGGSFFVGSIAEVEREGRSVGTGGHEPALLDARTGNLERLVELGQLACGVICDLNNDLTAILNYSRLGLMLGDLDPTVESYLRAIEGAADRAARVPDFLLGVAQQEPGAVTVVSLNQLLEQNRGMVERVLSRRMVAKFDLCRQECLARVDPVQLGQVMLNLTNNARDAMLGGGRLEVGLRLIDPDQIDGADGYVSDGGNGYWAAISFQDNGCGIPAEVAERAFELFFTTKPLGHGTGMGLPSVKRIVEHNGGRVALSSEIDRGTCVEIHLPLVDVQ